MNRVQVAWILLVGVAALGCAAGGTLEVKPANWPDLSTLDKYPNPFGDTCSADGTTERGGVPKGDKVSENDLKNRFYLPATYQPYTVDEMLRLPNESDDALEHTGVTLTGYVQDVKPGGTNGESCNCEATGASLVDAHIEVVTDPQAEGSEGRGMVVVEVPERSRRLANLGLLTSNIGKDWSTEQLRQQMKGKWVRFSGWLLFDSDHINESWSVDPEDNLGRRNWRGTPWEVHPVMGIEVLSGGSPEKP